MTYEILVNDEDQHKQVKNVLKNKPFMLTQDGFSKVYPQKFYVLPFESIKKIDIKKLLKSTGVRVQKRFYEKTTSFS